jgi:trehalose 6-phosphate synthase
MHTQGRAPLLIAANRGPVAVASVDDGDDSIQRGSGGLVSGMQAALAAVPDAVWVCAAMSDAERALVREAGGGRISDLPAVAEVLQGEFAVRMLGIDAQTFRNAYNGVANSTLWFMLHMLWDLTRQPVFDAVWWRQWQYYVRYNEIFAEALAAEAAPGAKVIVEDYHLFLVPKMLREMRPDLRIGLFIHTPWVTPGYFEVLPTAATHAIVEGMLGADMIGFHTTRWAELFRLTAKEVVGRDHDNIRAFPLGTDADELRERASQRDVSNALRRLERTVAGLKVIGRVDRTEPSKNVLRGLLAYRELLRNHPEWREKVVHVVYNNPSREDLAAYREYTAAVERLADKIDDEFRTEDWTPLILDIADDFPAALAVLRRSDVLLINSVRDGMNLVVQEGLLLSEHEPAVVLSRHAGAADLFGDDAFLVNPFDVSHAANALHDALMLDESERAIRAKRMREAAVALPPAEWFRAQLDALD